MDVVLLIYLTSEMCLLSLETQMILLTNVYLHSCNFRQSNVVFHIHSRSLMTFYIVEGQGMHE